MLFALSKEPSDYQLTVHYNNYEQCYGVGSFSRDFEYLRTRSAPKSMGAMHNFITHYGRGKVESFLTQVVGLKGVA